MSSGVLLDWVRIEKKEARQRLPGFECTVPWPETENGRRVAKHPRRWEWDAQRHVRTLWQNLRPGDRALIGVDEDTIDAAVVHLAFEVPEPSLVVGWIQVGAVARTHRRNGPGAGALLGDDVLRVAVRETYEELAAGPYDRAVVAGKIHIENAASMRMAARNGMEPQGDPTEEYVLWSRILADAREV